MINYLTRWYSIVILAGASLVALSTCTVQESIVTGNRRAYGYSWEQEKQLGDQSDKQIQAQYGVYNNDELDAYLQRVAQKVLENSDMRDPETPQQYRETEFTFRLLDSPVVNAFALPGGFVYVTRGLMANLRNEAQLAVVIGHEIGHVAARHSSQRAFEQQAAQLGLVAGAVAGEQFLGVPGGQLLNLGSQASQFLFLKYSRDDESESDKLGVEYAAKAGYKAAEGADFFTTLKRLSAQSGQSIPTWQSTHPDPSAREDRIPKLAQEWQQQGYAMNTVGLDDYMRAINRMVYGENPRLGYTENGMFYHPEMAFQFPYPSGWQVLNSAAQVQMANQEGNAVVQFQGDGQNETPQASVQQFVSQDGISAGQGQATSYNGLNGYLSSASAQTQDGQNLRLQVYAVQYNGTIFRFIAYTTANRYNTYASSFENIFRGFDRLTDNSILNKQPARLAVDQTTRDGSFSSFVPANLPYEITDEEVAISNQFQLNQPISSGTWIKIPQL